MSIEHLSIAAADYEVRGGLQYVAITTFDDATGVTFNNATGQHAVSAISGVGSAVLFDLQEGTGALSTSGSKDGGTILFEHTISFYVPNVSTAHLSAIESLRNQNLIVWGQSYAGKVYIIGVSEAFKLEDDISNQQMYATFSSVEGGTGSALGDDNGLTVTLTAQSGELVREFTGTFTLPTDGLGGMTIS